MHPSVMTWVDGIARAYGLTSSSVLEVGSLNVNGTVRGSFNGYYIGVDVQDGDGVDVVGSAHDLPFHDETWDVVVSTEMVEHDPAFWLSMKEMGRVLREGGLLLLTTRGIGFHYHGFPMDYWRFTQDAMLELMKLADCEMIELTADDFPEHPGWFMIGRKHGSG